MSNLTILRTCHPFIVAHFQGVKQPLPFFFNKRVPAINGCKRLLIPSDLFQAGLTPIPLQYNYYRV